MVFVILLKVLTMTKRFENDVTVRIPGVLRKPTACMHEQKLGHDVKGERERERERVMD